MKIKFYLAGTLLVVAGLLHLAVLILSPYELAGIIPSVFSLVIGAVYVVLGIMLLRLKDTFLNYTALIVLFGLIVDLRSSSSGAEGLSLILLIVEALALTVLAYLYIQSRAPLSRVQ